jgi:hypothetical protein
MRRRLDSLRQRSMARPTGEGARRFDLDPRARRLAGWLAAIVLVIGVAFVVGRLGGEAGGPENEPTPSASTTPTLLPIVFGTLLTAEGEVDPSSETSRFAVGDTFAYSVAAERPPGGRVYVEVVRVADGAEEPVQTPAPQELPAERAVVGFQVPVQNLIDVFGPGAYVMRIYVSRSAGPIAEGRFELLDAVPSG